MKQHKLVAIDEMVRKYATAGLTLAEAAQNLGLNKARVYARARKIGVRFRHGLMKAEPDARAVEMRDAYLQGRTLSEIGSEYGMTCERVRQIITKHFGRLRQDGGMALKTRKNKAQRLAALDAAALKRWGCTRQQYGVLQRMTKRLMANGVSRERTPIGAYARQKCTAKTRGIEFHLSLWEWWTIWQKSGKWARRGRERGQFVMCRIGDEGPYAVDNVFIALNCENVSAATRKDDLPIGVVEYCGRYAARTCLNGIVTRLGIFDTPQEAHIEYLKSLHREAA